MPCSAAWKSPSWAGESPPICSAPENRDNSRRAPLSHCPAPRALNGTCRIPAIHCANAQNAASVVASTLTSAVYECGESPQTRSVSAVHSYTTSASKQSVQF